MRIFLLFISVFVSYITVEYVREINRLESIIFSLYKSGFKKYLIVNEGFKIEYDKERLKNDFKEEGYYLKFKEGTLNFEVSFKKLLNFTKEYKFYLEENYELK